VIDRKSIIITGASGCLGSAIERAFIFSSKYFVYSIDYCDIFQKHARYRNNEYHKNMMFNLLDGKADIGVCISHDVEAIFHCAAIANTGTKINDIKIEQIVNKEIIMINRIIDLASKVKAKQVVLFTIEPGAMLGNYKNYDRFITIKNSIRELIKSNELIHWIEIPFLFGLFQDPSSIIPKIIFNSEELNLEEYKNTKIRIVSADDVASVLSEKTNFLSISGIYNWSVMLNIKDIPRVIQYIRTNNFEGLREIQFFNSNLAAHTMDLNNRYVKNLAYKLLEVVEHYEINKRYYTTLKEKE